MKIEGVYTALITPFNSNNSDIVNYEAYKKQLKFQISNGVSGLLPLGTTGETPTLTREEQDKIIECTVNEAKGKVVIVVGTGSNSTKATIENTKRAKDLGADAALVITPYYNKPTQEGIYRHFATVAEKADLPIIVYNIKGRTGVNIETSTLIRIAEIPQIVGVKEASGDMNQIGDVCKVLASDTFSVMSGDDSLTLPAMALGASGVISVVSNLIPAQLVEMVESVKKSDLPKALKIHRQLLPFFKGVFIETNPVPIKAAMNLCGMSCGQYRLPLCEMKKENLEKLKGILKDLKLL